MRASAKTLGATLLASAWAVPAAKAGEPTLDEILTRTWDLASIYSNPDHPVLQEIRLRGRYQGQYHSVDADQGEARDFDHRRVRLGIDARLFERKLDLRLDAEPDLNRGEYNGLVDAYLRYRPSPNLTLTLGKTKPLIGGYDWLDSTITQPTLERSQMFGQLDINRLSALTAEGKAGDITWQGGVYSTSINREFGQFDGGWAFGAGVGYDLADILGSDKAYLRLDWLHSNHHANSDRFRRHEDLLSLTFYLKGEEWLFVAEAFAGIHGPEEDVVGGFLQWSQDIVPGKLQGVARYSHARGSGDRSVRGQSRYEGSLGFQPRGERYNALYLGVQYFIHGDKLKLMAGSEYSSVAGGESASEYQGVTHFAGVRLSF